MPPPAAAANDAGTLALGTRLGELEIVRVLAASNFGVVYLATDHALALVVAIKEYLPATLAMHDALGQVRWRSAFDGDGFERGRLAFIDEARILARCEHPSLLRVHRVWAANGTVYRLMPHYAGQNLAAVRRGNSDNFKGSPWRGAAIPNKNSSHSSTGDGLALGTGVADFL